MPVIKIKNFTFNHIVDWEETASRTIAKKKPIGKVSPTLEAEVFVTAPRQIMIRARIDPDEKDDLWDLYNEAAWQQLTIDAALIHWVWIEKPLFTWDADLGWDDDERPFVTTLELIVSGT